MARWAEIAWRPRDAGPWRAHKSSITRCGGSHEARCGAVVALCAQLAVALVDQARQVIERGLWTFSRCNAIWAIMAFRTWGGSYRAFFRAGFAFWTCLARSLGNFVLVLIDWANTRPLCTGGAEVTLGTSLATNPRLCIVIVCKGRLFCNGRASVANVTSWAREVTEAALVCTLLGAVKARAANIAIKTPC